MRLFKTAEANREGREPTGSGPDPAPTTPLGQARAALEAAERRLAEVEERLRELEAGEGVTVSKLRNEAGWVSDPVARLAKQRELAERATTYDRARAQLLEERQAALLAVDQARRGLQAVEAQAAHAWHGLRVWQQQEREVLKRVAELQAEVERLQAVAADARRRQQDVTRQLAALGATIDEDAGADGAGG